MRIVKKIKTSISLLSLAFNYSSILSVISTLLNKRFTQGHIKLLGQKLRYTDQASVLKTSEEIFLNEIYEFKASTPYPLIIDCGANIGLSILYFKKLYPSAQIIGFEPDPATFEVLQHNINTYGLQHVELKKQAVWNEDCEMFFEAEGSESSHIIDEKQKSKGTKVTCIKLSDFLSNFEKIDFLKIDIEGAETTVVADLDETLQKCEHVFIEYHSFEGQNQTLSQILAALEKAGLRYKVQEAYAPSKPYMDHATHVNNMDLQLNIFAYKS